MKSYLPDSLPKIGWHDESEFNLDRLLGQVDVAIHNKSWGD